MEKLKFICLTWNNYLPQQSIIESTCGYYAYSNIVEFSKIIENCDNDNIIDIIKNKLKQSGYKKSIKDNIISYRKLIGKDMITREDASKIHIYEYNKTGKSTIDYEFEIYDGYGKLSPPYSVSTFKPDKIKKALMTEEDCIYKIMIESIHYNVINHMVPTIIQKIGNNVYIHILDSFRLLWNGDNILRELYKIILGTDITDRITCKDISTKESIVSIFNKLKEFVELVVVLVVILFILRI